MLRAILCTLMLSCTLAVAACGFVTPPPELDAAARDAFKEFVASDFDAMREAASNAEARAQIDQLARVVDYMPDTSPESVRRVSYSTYQSLSGGTSTFELVHEYGWPTHVAIATVSFEQAPSETAPAPKRINVNVATREELKIYDFDFGRASFLHVAMLAAVIISPLLMVTAIVMSIRTPEVERRWLWCIVSLVTVCAFTLDWTDGVLRWSLLHVGLISQGVSRLDTAFAPWTVSTAIPIGALIVIARLWARGRKIRKAASSA